jgi:hypothetical protein
MLITISLEMSIKKLVKLVAQTFLGRLLSPLFDADDSCCDIELSPSFESCLLRPIKIVWYVPKAFGVIRTFYPHSNPLPLRERGRDSLSSFGERARVRGQKSSPQKDTGPQSSGGT